MRTKQEQRETPNPKGHGETAFTVYIPGSQVPARKASAGKTPGGSFPATTGPAGAAPKGKARTKKETLIPPDQATDKGEAHPLLQEMAPEWRRFYLQVMKAAGTE